MVTKNTMHFVMNTVIILLSIALMVNLSLMGYFVLVNLEGVPSEGSAKCPNGICEFAAGENCSNCPQDCGICPPPCGDGICERDKFEDEVTCPQDCKAAPASNQIFANPPATVDNTMLIIGVTAGGMICAIFLVLYLFKFKQAKTVEKIPGEEVLIPYINQMRKSNYSDNQIKEELIKAGWKPDLVEKVLKKH